MILLILSAIGLGLVLTVVIDQSRTRRLPGIAVRVMVATAPLLVAIGAILK